MADDSNAIVPRQAEVIDYAAEGSSPSASVPTLPEAVARLQHAITTMNADDVILEYTRDRFGQINFRFRAYRTIK
jgi:hypothetical protein